MPGAAHRKRHDDHRPHGWGPVAAAPWTRDLSRSAEGPNLGQRLAQASLWRCAVHARSFPRTCGGAVVLALLAGGCASPLDPVASPPLATGSGFASEAATPREAAAAGAGWQAGFYPLRVGNRWLYQRQFVIVIVPSVGEPPPPPQFASMIERQIVCTERRGMREYLVEHAREQNSSGLSYDSWVRYRQDRTGLYEADLATGEAPACVSPPGASMRGERPPSLVGALPSADALALTGTGAERRAYRLAWQRVRERLVALEALLRGGPPAITGATRPWINLPGELARLRYPLQPGARWAIRNDPGLRWLARVEGVDDLNLPAGRLRGFRIRLTADMFGPHDVVHVWYGRAGFLQLSAHVEFDARDESGQIHGRVVADEREWLEDLWLSGPTLAGLGDPGAGSRR